MAVEPLTCAKRISAATIELMLAPRECPVTAVVYLGKHERRKNRRDSNDTKALLQGLKGRG